MSLSSDLSQLGTSHVVEQCRRAWETDRRQRRLSRSTPAVFFDCLLELCFFGRVSLVISRPCCSAGQLGLAQEFACVSFAVLYTIFLFDVVKQEPRRPRLLVITEFGRRLLELFKELFALFFVEFRWAARSVVVVGCLLGRFAREPVEPVADSLLNDAVTFSKCFEFITLLSTDCGQNLLPRNLSFCLLTQFLKFFQSGIVQPTRYIESILHW